MGLDMRNAVILHGAGETPKSFWLPYAKRELEKRGFAVSIPQLPDANQPDIAKWLPTALKEKYGSNTVIIAHSAGCPLLLSVLENVKPTIRKAILVAGYSTPLPKGANKILQEKYDWKKIRAHAKEFVFINSDNDPWGCDDRQGRQMLNRLGGTLIIPHGEAHMGSDKFNQPYKKFPLMAKIIE